MILYTIMPMEIIFQNQEDNRGNTSVTMDYKGVKVEAVMTSNNQYIINRILSTSPKVFLNPELQPGTVIKGDFKVQRSC